MQNCFTKLYEMVEQNNNKDPFKNDRIHLVMNSLVKTIKRKQFTEGSGTRFTRTMSKQRENFDSIELLNKVGHSRDLVSEELGIDLSITKKLDYKYNLVFNHSYAPTTKLPNKFLPIIYRFLVDKVYPNYLALKKNPNFQVPLKIQGDFVN